MSNKNIVIIKTQSGWGVKREGALKPMKSFALQGQAINYGRAMAKSMGSELIVSGMIGKSLDKGSTTKVINPYKR